MLMKKFYDAEYIIRKTNEYEEYRIYNSPTEQKLRAMVAEATRLCELENEKRTMIFHEAPHKLKTTLEDMKNTFGEDRRISLCRELTKKNEEVLRLTLASAVEYYENNAPRGEYVLIVEGSNKKKQNDVFFANMTIEEHVNFYISNGLSKMDAIKACAKDRGVHKNVIYKEICN